MNIQEFRKQYPDYDGVDDQELSQRLWEKHYKDQGVEQSDFNARFLGEGADEQPPGPPAHLRLAEAIKQVESKGDYGAKAKDQGFGAYQFMPDTWEEWSSKLNPEGVPLDPTPENQDLVAHTKIKEWMDAGLTEEEVVAKWNSGSHKGWGKKRGVNEFGVRYDVPHHVNKVMKEYRKGDKGKGVVPPPAAMDEGEGVSILPQEGGPGLPQGVAPILPPGVAPASQEMGWRDQLSALYDLSQAPRRWARRGGPLQYIPGFEEAAETLKEEALGAIPEFWMDPKKVGERARARIAASSPEEQAKAKKFQESMRGRGLDPLESLRDIGPQNIARFVTGIPEFIDQVIEGRGESIKGVLGTREMGEGGDPIRPNLTEIGMGFLEPYVESVKQKSWTPLLQHYVNRPFTGMFVDLSIFSSILRGGLNLRDSRAMRKKAHKALEDKVAAETPPEMDALQGILIDAGVPAQDVAAATRMMEEMPAFKRRGDVGVDELGRPVGPPKPPPPPPEPLIEGGGAPAPIVPTVEGPLLEVAGKSQRIEKSIMDLARESLQKQHEDFRKTAETRAKEPKGKPREPKVRTMGTDTGTPTEAPVSLITEEALVPKGGGVPRTILRKGERPPIVPEAKVEGVAPKVGGVAPKVEGVAPKVEEPIIEQIKRKVDEGLKEEGGLVPKPTVKMEKGVPTAKEVASTIDVSFKSVGEAREWGRRAAEGKVPGLRVDLAEKGLKRKIKDLKKEAEAKEDVGISVQREWMEAALEEFKVAGKPKPPKPPKPGPKGGGGKKVPTKKASVKKVPTKKAPVKKVAAAKEKKAAPGVKGKAGKLVKQMKEMEKKLKDEKGEVHWFTEPKERKNPKVVAARVKRMEGMPPEEWHAGKYDKQKALEISDIAKKKVGVTKDPREASFMLEDGEMLKMPGDLHAQIWFYVDPKVYRPWKNELDSVHSFQAATNSIRVKEMEGAVAFEMTGPPTQSQLNVIRRISKDKKVFVDAMDPHTEALMSTFGMEPFNLETFERMVKEGFIEASPITKGKGNKGDFKEMMEEMEGANKKKLAFKAKMKEKLEEEKGQIPGFSSRLRDKTKEEFPESSTGNLAAKWFLGKQRKGEIPKDEIEYSGVLEWVEGKKGRITKDELMEYLEGMGGKVVDKIGKKLKEEEGSIRFNRRTEREKKYVAAMKNLRSAVKGEEKRMAAEFEATAASMSQGLRGTRPSTKTAVEEALGKGPKDARKQVHKALEDELWTPESHSPNSEAALRYLKSGKFEDYVEGMPEMGELKPGDVRGKAGVADVRASGQYVHTSFASQFVDVGADGKVSMKSPDIPKNWGSTLDPSRLIEWGDEKFGGELAKKLLRPARDTIRARLAWEYEWDKEIVDLVNKHGIKSMKDRRKLGRLMLGEEVKLPQRFHDAKVAADALYARGLEQMNAARAKRGQPLIPRREDFGMPWAVEQTFRQKLWGSKALPEGIVEKGPVPDYIKPNKPFNPHELARDAEYGAYVKQKDAIKVLVDYGKTSSRDIFNTNIIHNNKVHASWLKDVGLDNLSNAIGEWTTDVFAGRAHWIDRNLGQLGAVPHALLKGQRRLKSAKMRTLFALNVPWNLWIQTSSVAMLLPRVGLGNAIKGLEVFINPKMKRVVEQTYTHVMKGSTNPEVGAFKQTVKEFKELQGMGVLDRTADRLNFFTKWLEKNLTDHAIAAGWHEGGRRGLTGRDRLEFASDVGARVHSMYNFEDLPALLRSKDLKASFPLQTFSFEALNNFRELSGGKGAYGGMGKSKRAGRMLQWMAGMYVANQLSQQFLGRDAWNFLSFIPFGASLASFAGLDVPGGRYDAYRPMLAQFIADTQRAARNAAYYDDWTATRQLMNSWLMVGGTQVERVMATEEARKQGWRVRDVSGRTLYRIPKEERAGSYITGTWKTGAGMRVKEKGEKITLEKILGGPIPEHAKSEKLREMRREKKMEQRAR